ncbi:MAG TPA: hypothetical protein VJ945_02345, partial [Flavobacteriaceae bacterium]|nr:hypothetical protein [Flavobacteriaceae bacterium]
IVRPTHPDPKVKLRFNWNAAINIDPFDNNTLYFGSQFVHKSTDKGETWTIISPDLTTNDPEKQKQDKSGGLTMDATGAENYTTIIVIEPSPVEKNMLWVGTDDGRVQVTRDGGITWTDVSKNIKGLPAGSWIPQIKASNKHKGEALLVANDYRRFNYTPYVYRTKDYGKTWERIVDGNDVKSYALCILEDIEEPNLMFLGTDDGLYISLDAGNKWTKWTAGFPTVSVKDLIIQPRENDLDIATFGRAVWVLDDIRPLCALAKNKDILNQKIKLFSPPTAYEVAYQQPTAGRFGADGTFSGENRGFGAQLSYYVKIDQKKEEAKKEEDMDDKKDEDGEDSKKEEAKVKWDSITMMVYDGDRLIRTLKHKAPDSSGIYRTSWYLNEAGVDRPSRTIRKRKREPSGVSVKPGTYKVVMTFGDQTSEQMITVKTDPRLDVSMSNISEIYAASKNLEHMQQTEADAVKQLVESKQIAEKFQKDLKKLDKDKYKDNIKSSKDIVKQIDDLIAIYLGKEDKRQGITQGPEDDVNHFMNLARYYVGSRQHGLTSTETTLVKNAKDALNEALDKTNTFFNETWKSYQDNMEQLQASPFKEVKSFHLD